MSMTFFMPFDTERAHPLTGDEIRLCVWIAFRNAVASARRQLRLQPQDAQHEEWGITPDGRFVTASVTAGDGRSATCAAAFRFPEVSDG